MDLQKRKKLGNKFILVVLLCAIGVSAYQLAQDYFSGKQAKQAYEELKLQVRSTNEVPEEATVSEELIETEEKEVPKLYPALDVDVEALKNINEDFRGWLYYPGLDISYPVVQASDNDYYLHRSFEREELTAGCIFMDCGATPDFSDRNTFIFGHNMRDGSMFGSLKKLVSDTAICEENPYFYIYTQEAVYTYEIFAYYRVKEDSERYMTFSMDKTYDTYVEWALENSIYQKEIDLSERNNIVTLSTCYGASGSGKRLLVHGVLIRTEDY